MKKSLFTFFSLFSYFSIQAQEAYMIEDFSDKYYAKIVPLDSDNPYQNVATIFIYERGTNEELIQMDSDNISYPIKDGGGDMADIMEWPYEKQYILIYDDFNFDGEKDFALEDGMNSCYGGSALYQIYLMKKGRAIHSEEFTNISQNNCGFFRYDADTKKIHTKAESGNNCQQFSEFVVTEGIPILERLVEECYWLYYYSVLESISSDSININKYTRYFYSEDIEPLFSFTITKNNKKVLLFKDQYDTLNFVFLKPNNEIDFFHPYDVDSNLNDGYNFEKQNKESTLTFFDGDTEYKIYNSGKKVGMKVTSEGKITDMSGKIMNGSTLENLIENNNFANVSK